MFNVFTTADLKRYDVDPHRISRYLKCCTLKTGFGSYAVIRRCVGHPELHRFLDDDAALLRYSTVLAEGRRPEADHELSRWLHRARAAGSVHKLSPSEAFSHETAAVIHGFPLRGRAPDRVFTTTSRELRSAKFAKRKRRPLPNEHVCVATGLRTTSPLRTVLDICHDRDLETAVMVADAFLDYRTRDPREARRELEGTLTESNYYRSPDRIRDRLAIATGYSESAGESRCSLLFTKIGMIGFIQQYEVADMFGNVIARIDFYFPDHKLIVEFDGMVKYGGADGREALEKEKLRADRLGALGYVICRLVWSDLRTEGTFRHALRFTPLSNRV